jgi:hypothetical protein
MRAISPQTAFAASALSAVHGDIATSDSQFRGDCGSDSATTTSHKSDAILQVFHPSSAEQLRQSQLRLLHVIVYPECPETATIHEKRDCSRNDPSFQISS